jgi:SpoIID/LytB domain protein
VRRGLLAGLVGLGVVAVVQVPAQPASAAITGSVQFSGHGYGHGRGMGQWGAYGYATTGAKYTDIVSHYYGGTTLGGQADGVITVGLSGQDGADLVVTSGRDFTAGGVNVPAGSAARLRALADGSYQISVTAGCAAPGGAMSPAGNGRVFANVDPGNDLGGMLSLCTATGTRQYRGELSVTYANGAQHTVNTVWMEQYLRGVVPRESPASWGDAAGGKGIEALKAQAVAARSYAWSENKTTYAKTCDTVTCQVYGGAGINGGSIEDRRTDAAVAGTAGVVLRGGNGAIVRTEFSSSTGGHTAGGTFPAVVDLGDSASPYHDWTQPVSATTIATAFGVGELVEIKVTKRNGLGADGGRVTAVQVVGTAKTVSTTGSDVRAKLGLRSDWFSIAGVSQSVPPAVQPVMHLASSNAVGAGAVGVPFGQSGDVPLSCDWNGDGINSLGVFRKGTFFVTDDPAASTGVRAFSYGDSGDQPICGDWDGNGTDTVGVYRNGVVFLRNSNTSGMADGRYAFGQAGDRIVAGDWNNDSYDTVAIWRNGKYHWTNSNLVATTDGTAALGDPTDAPVVGDWDGNGSDTFGVFRSGIFYLRNDTASGVSELTVLFGDLGDKPMSGRWQSAGGGDVVGVARSY